MESRRYPLHLSVLETRWKRVRDDDDNTDDVSHESPNDVSQFYDIVKVSEKYVKEYGATSTDYNILFKLLDKDSINVNTFPQILGQIFEHLLQRLNNSISAHDMIRIVITSDNLETPVALPFIRRRDMTVEQIMAKIESILQSHQELYLDGSLHLNLVHLKMPSGGGNTRSFIGTQTVEFFLSKRCVIRIPKDRHNLCCARAIVTAIAIAENKDPKLAQIKKGRIIQLHADAGVPEGRCGIPEIERCRRYQINVLSSLQSPNVLYRGPNLTIILYCNPMLFTARATIVTYIIMIDFYTHVRILL